LALPVACSVTAFIILSPVVKGLGSGEKTRTLLLYCVAIGSLISFGLVYPTPAVIPLVQSLAPDLSPALYDALAIPLSLLLLFCFLLMYRFWFGSCDKPESMARPDDFPPKTVSSSEKRNLRAYAPFIA